MIPNEVRPTCCRATPTLKLVSRRDPHPGLGRGGGGVYSESYTHEARFQEEEEEEFIQNLAPAIANVGPTHCRATPASTGQPRAMRNARKSQIITETLGCRPRRLCRPCPKHKARLKARTLVLVSFSRSRPQSMLLARCAAHRSVVAQLSRAVPIPHKPPLPCPCPSALFPPPSSFFRLFAHAEQSTSLLLLLSFGGCSLGRGLGCLGWAGVCCRLSKRVTSTGQ